MGQNPARTHGWKSFVKYAQPSPGDVIKPHPAQMAKSQVPQDGEAHSRQAGANPLFEQAYQFYRDVAPEMRRRELGVDRLPDDEINAFKSLQNIPVDMVESLPDGVSGRHNYKSSFLSWLPGVRKEFIEIDKNMAGKDIAKTLVHELRHALARRLKTDRGVFDKLDSQWKFRGHDISGDSRYNRNYGDEEMATTNKEHQFIIYRDLWSKLGRPPTPDEYFSKVDEMGDDGSWMDSRAIKVNGYQSNADDFRAVPNTEENKNGFLDVMKNVSMNNPYALPRWSAYVPGRKGRV